MAAAAAASAPEADENHDEDEVLDFKEAVKLFPDYAQFLDPSKAKAELFADGVFVLEHDKGKKIHVHVERRFLAVESPGYFRPLFFGRFEESRMDAVPVHDVSVGDFLHLLSIVYNPKPVCYAESSEEELLADLFACEETKQVCSRFLRKSIPNCTTFPSLKIYFEIADRYRDLNDLIPTCIERICYDLVDSILDQKWIMSLETSTRDVILQRVQSTIRSHFYWVDFSHEYSVSMKKLTKSTSLKEKAPSIEKKEPVEEDTRKFLNAADAEELASDATLVVEQDGLKIPVYVHRARLAMTSPFFKKLFYKDGVAKEQKEFPIPNVKVDDLVQYLVCQYRKLAEVNTTNHVAVTTLAKRFKCDFVVEKSINYFKEYNPVTADDLKAMVELGSRCALLKIVRIACTSQIWKRLLYAGLNSDWLFTLSHESQIIVLSQLKKNLAAEPERDVWKNHMT